jgi:excisionase family DNA binding protein
VGPPHAGLLQIFHLTRTLSPVTSAVEIRPGSVQARELEVIERVLARDGGEGARLVDSAGDLVEMPAELVGVLKTIVEHLRAGHGVSVASLQAELTTVEAAELLNVSRPHLIKLVDGGALPFRMVGTHRRLRLVDVLAYRDSQDAASREALDELTRQAEDLGLYD